MDPSKAQFFAVPLATMQQVVQILDTLPHGQVRQAIDSLSACRPVQVAEAPDDAPAPAAEGG